MIRLPLTYALVTPVKDEEVNLARLAEAIERQTVTPSAWVIVDTGSTDGTSALVEELTRRLPFVRSLSVEGPAVATRGGPIVRAFVAGIESLETAPDVLIKQDADTSFDRDYFERVLAEFAADPRLGLASGLGLEPRDGEWRAVYGTRAFVWGPSRAYRWECLQQVLPLEERRGWDEIDSIKAQIRGWRVGTLAEIPFRHHRPEGTRDGSRRWARMGGEAHYMGYRFSYLVVRAAWRARRDPFALAMPAGYVRAVIRREPRCPDAAVRAHLSKEQSVWRLPLRLRESLGRVVRVV
jgi:glycosyltransferase involved in cell wall biosynthesis